MLHVSVVWVRIILIIPPSTKQQKPALPLYWRRPGQDCPHCHICYHSSEWFGYSLTFILCKRPKYGRHQAACREPAGSYDNTTRTAICFEHKTQFILIRAPYTRIMVFWHNSNIPLMISQSQISCNTHTFYIAAIFVKYCYTTGSWLV